MMYIHIFISEALKEKNEPGAGRRDDGTGMKNTRFL